MIVFDLYFLKKQQTQVAEKLLKQLFCLISGHKARQKFGNLI